MRVLRGVTLAALLAVVAVLLTDVDAIHGGSSAATSSYAAEPPPPAPIANRPPWAMPKPPSAPRFLIGRVTAPIPTPYGTIPTTTPLGSPTWLWVLWHKGREGTVIVPGSPNARLARIDLSRLKLRWTRVHVSIDLGRRDVRVIRAGELVARFPAAIGTRSTPTPTGRFSVTDRIAFPAGSIYGRFAVGISAHQTSALPASWTGGDQIAIHGTNEPASIGRAASLGCLRVGNRGLRVLERMVPLGTPVLIHP
jgi:lipoprotein-anchoring transpeptidase ErfK/SrfK